MGSGRVEARWVARPSRVAVACLSILLSSACATAAPTAQANPAAQATLPPTAVPVVTGRHVSVADFGARPDDGKDDTAAVQRALSSLHEGDQLTFPAGTYQHRAVLTASVPGVSIVGIGATLSATEESASAFHIDADRVIVTGMTFATPTTTRRWANTEQHKIWISGHDGVVLSRVTVLGSAAAGIFVDGGASNFRINDVTVRDTRADGIHITDGSNNGTIDRPTVSDTGDDGVAVVSYDKDRAPCTAITVNSPRVLGTTWGRGVTIVGGSNIVYTDVDVERTNAAGIYIAAEGDPWYTQSVDNVAIRGGRVVGANTNADIDQGAVVVYLGRTDAHVNDVQIQDITVMNTRNTASRNIGVIGTGAASPTGVVFTGMTISGGPDAQYGGNTPTASYRVEP